MNQNTKEGLSLSELRSMGYDDLQKLSEEGLVMKKLCLLLVKV